MGDMIAAIAHQWNEPLVELSALVQDIQTSYLLKWTKRGKCKRFCKWFYGSNKIYVKNSKWF